MEFSRFVDYWQAKRNLHTHERRLKTIKPMIDTTNSLYQIKDRNKSLNSQKGYNHRNFQIQMENKALLSKLTKNKIHNSCNKTPNQQSYIIKRNRNKYNKDNIFNHLQRQYQNKDLLHKITNIKGSYSARVLASQYKQNKKYMNLICKYPLEGLKPTKTFLKLNLNRSKARLIQPNKDQTLVYQRLNTNQFQNKGTNTQRQRSPIENQSKIMKTRKLAINGIQILVKGIIQCAGLTLQIIQDRTFKEIKLPLVKFVEHYGADYEELLDAIRYNCQIRQFFLYQ